MPLVAPPRVVSVVGPFAVYAGPIGAAQSRGLYPLASVDNGATVVSTEGIPMAGPGRIIGIGCIADQPIAGSVLEVRSAAQFTSDSTNVLIIPIGQRQGGIRFAGGLAFTAGQVLWTSIITAAGWSTPANTRFIVSLEVELA